MAPGPLLRRLARRHVSQIARQVETGDYCALICIIRRFFASPKTKPSTDPCLVMER